LLCFPAALIIIGLIIADKGGTGIRNRLVLLLSARRTQFTCYTPVAIGQLIKITPLTPLVSWTISALAIGATVAVQSAFTCS
jgi:hypothetical protein